MGLTKGERENDIDGQQLQDARRTQDLIFCSGLLQLCHGSRLVNVKRPIDPMLKGRHLALC
jgi:hypothetical protein